MIAPLLVRPACTEDIPRLIELYGSLYDLLQAMGMPFALEQKGLARLLPVLLESKLCYLAVAESSQGQVCGFISASIFRLDRKLSYGDDASVAKIHDICVDEAYRGGEAAGLLLRCAEDWLRERGVRLCESEILMENHRSLGFFKKNGYTPFCYLTYKEL